MQSASVGVAQRSTDNVPSSPTGRGVGGSKTAPWSPPPPATDCATTITTTTPITAAVPTPTHAMGRATYARAAGMAKNPRSRRRPASGRQAASSWRPRSSSFPSMFEMWYLTASPLMPRRAAISAFVPPSRSSSRTRHSAGVRTSGWRGRPRGLRSIGAIVGAGRPIFPTRSPVGRRGSRLPATARTTPLRGRSTPCAGSGGRRAGTGASSPGSARTRPSCLDA